MMNSWILVFIIFIVPSKSDNVCPDLLDVLCVEDVLATIATLARDVNRTVNEIETKIIDDIKINQTFYRYMYYEVGFLTKLPKPYFHTRFHNTTQIQRKNLTQVVLEAHRALGFYYNSIEFIISPADSFSNQIYSKLKHVESQLKTMMCRCRRILNVYDHEWPQLEQLDRVHFSDQNHPPIRSIKNDVRSLIIVRLLREWLNRIHHFCRNQLKTATISPHFVDFDF